MARARLRIWLSAHDEPYEIQVRTVDQTRLYWTDRQTPPNKANVISVIEHSGEAGYIDIDLTDYLRILNDEFGYGHFTLALTTNTHQSIQLHSRESEQPPQLLLTSDKPPGNGAGTADSLKIFADQSSSQDASGFNQTPSLGQWNAHLVKVDLSKVSLGQSADYRVYVSHIDPRIRSNIRLIACGVNNPALDWREGASQLPKPKQHSLGICLMPYGQVKIPPDGAGAYYSVDLSVLTTMATLSGQKHASFALISNQEHWIQIHSRNHSRHKPQWEMK